MAKPVSIKFAELFEKDIINKIIEDAFGPNSLGIILIREFPEIGEFRPNLIRAGRKFIGLKNKSKYEIPEALYSVGWSYGKEKMKNNTPDFAKGSYYANPITDEATKDKELIKKYPSSYHPNIWPNEVPEFENEFKNVGTNIIMTGLLLLSYCDNYLKKQGIDSKLEKLIHNCTSHKGRFLHYYPAKSNQNKEDDALCGWHCDSGGLTGLLPAMYFDKDGNKIPKPDDCGLFIKDRNNNLVKVDIPEDAIGYQIGEILQILSGGKLIATPHCVKSTKKEGVTRNTMAVFMDIPPNHKIYVPDKNKLKEVIHIRNLPKGVPKMEDRFNNGITYAEFLKKSYEAYYD